jgi:polyhydroxybutyrate depolymerase
MHFQDAWPEAIVVYPQGLPTPGIVLDHEGVQPGWQREPGQQQDRDLKFVDAMVETLRKKFAADDRRIYATGFSNGGLFTYLLWSQRPNVFAAFAPGGAVRLPSVELTQPRAVFHYAGRSDRLARFTRQEQTIEEIRKLNGCSPKGENCGTNCTLYSSASGTPVATFIHSGGHLYPPPVTDLIVKFFREQVHKP